MRVQRLGKRIILSCDDEGALNAAIERLSQDSRVVSIASWRENAGITAVLTLEDGKERKPRLCRMPRKKAA